MDTAINFPMEAKRVRNILDRGNGRIQARVLLSENDFKDIKLNGISVGSSLSSAWNYAETCAFIDWKAEVLLSRQPVMLEFKRYDADTLVCRKCVDVGSRGDRDGFGLEPPKWVSALFHMNGRIKEPFRPGYISVPQQTDK